MVRVSGSAKGTFLIRLVSSESNWLAIALAQLGRTMPEYLVVFKTHVSKVLSCPAIGIVPVRDCIYFRLVLLYNWRLPVSVLAHGSCSTAYSNSPER